MRVAFVVMLGPAAMPASADEYLKSVSPKSSVDGFLAMCRAEAADPWCRCLVRTMVQTREGDFLVDAAAASRRMTNIQKSVGVERAKAVAGRHGLTREDALAILNKADDYLKSAGDSCG